MKIQSKINAYSGMRFYKENGGQNITENVKSGKTVLFKEKSEADKFARQKRSYVEGVRYTDAETKHKKTKIYGYGVPA